MLEHAFKAKLFFLFCRQALRWPNGEIQVPFGFKDLALFCYVVLISPAPPPLTVRLGFRMAFWGLARL